MNKMNKALNSDYFAELVFDIKERIYKVYSYSTQNTYYKGTKHQCRRYIRSTNGRIPMQNAIS